MDKAQGNIIIDPDIKINIEQLNTTQKPSKLATSPNEWTLKIGTINNNETGNTLTD